MTTDPAAAAVAAAMMQGMRLPLALTKKQMKGAAADFPGLQQHHSNGNGRLSPAPDEKEGETFNVHFTDVFALFSESYCILI